MLKNLPPILSISKQSSPVQGAPKPSDHAQDLTIAKLQQRKDKEGARVSMNQIMMEKEGRPVTSISHTLQGADPIAPIDRPEEEREAYDETDYDPSRQRYTYIKKLLAEREGKKATQEVEKEKSAKKFWSGRTGSQFRITGPTGFRKSLERLVWKKRGQYRNISIADRKLFQSTIERTLGSKLAGQKFGRKDYIKLRYEFYKKWKKEHVITKEDFEDFKQLLKDLKEGK